jgi:hypothetical protein
LVSELGKRRKSNNDPFGFGSFDSGLSSFSKRATFENSKFRGRMAEDSFALDQTLRGKEVRRIHKGGDFEVRDPETDMFGNRRRRSKPVTYEVKTGNSQLSDAQKRKQRLLGKRRYKVVRY